MVEINRDSQQDYERRHGGKDAGVFIQGEFALDYNDGKIHWEDVIVLSGGWYYPTGAVMREGGWSSDGGYERFEPSGGHTSDMVRAAYWSHLAEKYASAFQQLKDQLAAAADQFALRGYGASQVEAKLPELERLRDQTRHARQSLRQALQNAAKSAPAGKVKVLPTPEEVAEREARVAADRREADRLKSVLNALTL